MWRNLAERLNDATYMPVWTYARQHVSLDVRIRVRIEVEVIEMIRDALIHATYDEPVRV
jgi:hypothetical protein